MFSSILVHLGQRKTGTTTLQKTLQANRDLLLGHGVVVTPNVAGGAANVGAVFVARREDTPGHLIEKFGEPTAFADKTLAHWRELAAEHAGKRLILSCEHLFIQKHPDGLQRLVDALKTIAHNVTGIVYLRDPVSLIPSVWGQGIKAGASSMTLEDRLAQENWLKKFDTAPFVQAWTSVLDLWAVDASGDSVSAFCRDARLPELEPAPHANQSLGVNGCEVIRLANAENIAPSTRAKMVKALLRMGDEKLTLTEEQRLIVNRRFKSGQNKESAQ